VVCRQDGTRIAYDVVGDGPLVLFVHGMTSSRQRWDPVTDLLASDFTCVRINLPGHGESSTAPTTACKRWSATFGQSPTISALGRRLSSAIHLVRSWPRSLPRSIRPAPSCASTRRCAGQFRALVQARERELRGAQPMEAVLAIDHELGLGPYEDTVLTRPGLGGGLRSHETDIVCRAGPPRHQSSIPRARSASLVRSAPNSRSDGAAVARTSRVRRSTAAWRTPRDSSRVAALSV
jgi:hypothetical protein